MLCLFVEMVVVEPIVYGQQTGSTLDEIGTQTKREIGPRDFVLKLYDTVKIR